PARLCEAVSCSPVPRRWVRAVSPHFVRSSCRPLPSGGITRRQQYYWGIPHPGAHLPSSLVAVVGHTLLSVPGKSARASRVAVRSRCRTCRGHRPRGCKDRLTLAAIPVVASAKSTASPIPRYGLTGLNPFTLAHYGLHACCPTLKARDCSLTSKDLLPGGWLTFRGGNRTRSIWRPCPAAPTLSNFTIMKAPILEVFCYQYGGFSTSIRRRDV